MAVSELSLGYIGVGATDLDAWATLGHTLFGCEVLADDGLRFRLDDRAHRFLIRPADEDRLAFIGWEACDATALAAFRDRVLAAGYAIDVLSAEEREIRRVEDGFRFTGPFGVTWEGVAGWARADAPVRLDGVSGFVGGDLGLGHLAFLTDDLGGARKAFDAILGTRHRDDIIAENGGRGMELTFLSLNPRHHTIALAAFNDDGPRPPERLAHVAIEMASVADVERAYERAVTGGFRIGRTIGQHPNDLATSFYVLTPGGFEVEVTGGCLVVEREEEWRPKVHDIFSLWGHAREVDLLAPR